MASMVSRFSASMPHFETGQRGEAHSIRRIVNIEALVVLALLLAACAYHLA